MKQAVFMGQAVFMELDDTKKNESPYVLLE
jgi:hypothetical protein